MRMAYETEMLLEGSALCGLVDYKGCTRGRNRRCVRKGVCIYGSFGCRN